MNGVHDRYSLSYRLMRLFAPNLILKFLYYLRKEEYYTNKKLLLRFYYMYKKR